MNEIVNIFLLAGDKFMPEMNLRNLVLLTVLVVHLPKTKKELKNVCRQKIWFSFTEMSFIKLVFNTIWLMANQRLSKKNPIRQIFER